MKPTVVVTRPADDGSRTADLLRSSDWPVWVQPIIQIAPLAEDAFSAVPEFEPDDRVVFISANAVSYGLPLLEERLRCSGVKILAVGERTAANLRAAGLDVVVPSNANSEGLLALPELNDLSGERVVIVKGDGGRQLLAEVLTARSAVVLEYVCYRRQVEPIDAVTFAENLARVGRLIFQANSGETLKQLTELLAAGGQPNLCHEPVVVPSARLASFATQLGWTSVWTAKDASDQAFLELIEHRTAPELNQEDIMTEEVQADSPEASAPTVVTAGADDVVEPQPNVPESTVKYSRDGFARSLVALILLLIAAAAWLAVWQGKPWLDARDARWQSISGNLASLSEERSSQLAALTEMERDLRQSIEQQLTIIAEADNQSLAQMRETAQDNRLSQEDVLRRFDNRLAELEAQLARLTGTDRRSWLLQESTFLVRLASQRLLVARDVDSAVALLGNADDLLLQANDPVFDAARRAIAMDRAALRSLPSVDVIGLHARFSALIRQAEAVAIDTQEAAPVQVAVNLSDGGLLERAQAGWQLALSKLSSYVIIRDRTEATAALMTPQWEALARQNLRMLLEQGQIALISGNQSLYVTATGAAARFAEDLRSADPARIDAMLAELQILAAAPISPTLPDLLPSRQALDGAIRAIQTARVVN